VSAPGTACPSSHPFASLAVFARTGGTPDDLLALPDGSLWVSDPNRGTVVHLDRRGRILETIRDANAPEGVVRLPDGRMILAEQHTNRLVVLPSRTTFFRLAPAGAALGVDGIGYDPARRVLLVPDSAHGRLLAVTTSGRSSRLLAGGLGRIVGATTGPDGAVYVVAEETRGLLRVAATGGSASAIAGVEQADDVVSAGGLLYLTLIRAGEVLALDPTRPSSRWVLVSGIGSVQGLAVLADGRLAVADSNTGTIRAIQACRAGA
jgi:sugar lactone lactonase YvrE